MGATATACLALLLLAVTGNDAVSPTPAASFGIRAAASPTLTDTVSGPPPRSLPAERVSGSAPKATPSAADANALWAATLEAEFERVRTLLPTLEYTAAKALLEEAKATVGPRLPTFHYPQDKIEHMVVLFVENRASSSFEHAFRSGFQ